MGTTANYGWTYPTVNADADTWGTKLNNMAIAIDAQMFTNAGLAAPKANPTFTGTVTVAALTASGTATFADSGTWGSGGIAGLTKLGIGMTPTNILDITQSQNADSSVVLANANVSGSARSLFNAYNGLHQARFGICGQGYTTSGILVANNAFISTTSNLAISSGGVVAVAVGGSTAEKARFASDGSFLVGSTTSAGAGYIAATGDVIAFYSDERLKKRLGPISNALGIIKALDGFYYEENDFAVSLGYERKRQIGLSAQQVNAVVPEVIARAPISDVAKMDLLTLKYDRIVAVLVEAVKELSSEVDSLKANAA